MDFGIGFSEIIVILILVLVLFGSKELPRFIREAAKITAKARQYSDKIRRELDSAVNVVTDTFDITAAQSEAEDLVREKYLGVRNGLDPQARAEKSASIRRYLLDSEQVKNAGAIMMYVEMGSEVETRETIRQLLAMGKRVVIPYCQKALHTLGFSEITDIDNNIVVGEEGMPELLPEFRKQFYRSDLNLVVCPGLIFDQYGNRMGMNNDLYSNFLREIQGSVPVIGLAFDCQVQDEHLPFSNFKIVMNDIITESGLKTISVLTMPLPYLPRPASEKPTV
jgi:5-formyltetrahydrofolate cyclo-ligase